MAACVRVLLGTTKGAFVLEGDAERRSFTVNGPFCDTWPIHHVIADPATATLYAGGGNRWTGPGVWRSDDLGQSWTLHAEGLALEEGEEPAKSVWSLAVAGDVLYAGIEPAALFQSADGGRSWRHVEGLRRHPSRPHWMPGGGGLMLHSLVPHPEDDRRLWVGISAAGVFHTMDGGESFEARNRGTRADFMPEEDRYPEFGQCVHSLVMAPGTSERLYQQNHCGMYRSDDGGLSWHSIEAGLPSAFGFPAVTHPRDPDTLYLVPLNGDSAGRYVPDARAAVWRTRDGGRSWQDLRQGLPQENVFFAVLRQAMAVDGLVPAGVYFGTNTGTLYASADEGESWRAVTSHLPLILSVETFVTND